MSSNGSHLMRDVPEPNPVAEGAGDEENDATVDPGRSCSPPNLPLDLRQKSSTEKEYDEGFSEMADADAISPQDGESCEAGAEPREREDDEGTIPSMDIQYQHWIRYGTVPILGPLRNVRTSQTQADNEDAAEQSMQDGAVAVRRRLLPVALAILERVREWYPSFEHYVEAAHGPVISKREAGSFLATYPRDIGIPGKLSLKWDRSLRVAGRVIVTAQSNKPEERRFTLVVHDPMEQETPSVRRSDSESSTTDANSKKEGTVESTTASTNSGEAAASKPALSTVFRQMGVRAFAAHELGTHLVRSLNDGRQPWAFRRRKWGLLPGSDPSSVRTEEGLATLNTVLHSRDPNLFGAALLYVSVCAADVMGFAELERVLQRWIPDPSVRFRCAARVKHGVADASLPGAQPHPQCYLEGAAQVAHVFATTLRAEGQQMARPGSSLPAIVQAGCRGVRAASPAAAGPGQEEQDDDEDGSPIEYPIMEQMGPRLPDLPPLRRIPSEGSTGAAWLQPFRRLLDEPLSTEAELVPAPFVPSTVEELITLLYTGRVSVGELGRVRRIARTETAAIPDFARPFRAYARAIVQLGRCNGLLSPAESAMPQPPPAKPISRTLRKKHDAILSAAAERGRQKRKKQLQLQQPWAPLPPVPTTPIRIRQTDEEAEAAAAAVTPLRTHTFPPANRPAAAREKTRCKSAVRIRRRKAAPRCRPLVSHTAPPSPGGIASPAPSSPADVPQKSCVDPPSVALPRSPSHKGKIATPRVQKRSTPRPSPASPVQLPRRGGTPEETKTLPSGIRRQSVAMLPSPVRWPRWKQKGPLRSGGEGPLNVVGLKPPL